VPVILVVEHDPAWAARFQALRAEYARALAAAAVPVIGIEHVGSTAVPGLAAKPVIDCDIVVAAAEVDAASAVLVSLGFRPLGELGIAQRWAFAEPARLAGTNTYVVVEGSLALRNHRAVRDVLRADARLRAEYAQVKLELATGAADMDAYVAGKNAVLQRILAAAGFSAQDRAVILASQPAEGPA
jgi:GrpB-like predicted nucleotidyltransferase (UPF0157 family)